MANKRILRICEGEYLLDVSQGAVVTTRNKDVAMDISDWGFNQTTFIISNLQKVGYVGAKIIDVVDGDKDKDETTEEVKEDTEE
jgi:hypothetical protein